MRFRYGHKRARLRTPALLALTILALGTGAATRENADAASTREAAEPARATLSLRHGRNVRGTAIVVAHLSSRQIVTSLSARGLRFPALRKRPTYLEFSVARLCGGRIGARRALKIRITRADATVGPWTLGVRARCRGRKPLGVFFEVSLLVEKPHAVLSASAGSIPAVR